MASGSWIRRSYLQHDATALAELVARGDVTSPELLTLARGRRDEVNPTLNAVVLDLGDVADRRPADPALVGPFAGVPFLVKDLGRRGACPAERGPRSRPASSLPLEPTTALVPSGSPPPDTAWWA